jgi:hypothetical protein
MEHGCAPGRGCEVALTVLGVRFMRIGGRQARTGAARTVMRRAMMCTRAAAPLPMTPPSTTTATALPAWTRYVGRAEGQGAPAGVCSGLYHMYAWRATHVCRYRVRGMRACVGLRRVEHACRLHVADGVRVWGRPRRAWRTRTSFAPTRARSASSSWATRRPRTLAFPRRT